MGADKYGRAPIIIDGNPSFHECHRARHEDGHIGTQRAWRPQHAHWRERAGRESVEET